MSRQKDFYMAESERIAFEMFENSLQTISIKQSAGESIFHYTDGNAFLSIIQNGKLRATHHKYLNDPVETKYGKQVITELLADKSFLNKFGDDERNLLGRLLDELLLDYGNAFSIYTASFSEQPDILSQWRAYADSAKGFSIGYKPSSFNLLGQNDEGVIFKGLLKVIYDKEEFKEFASEVISECLRSGGEYNSFGADLFVDSIKAVLHVLANLCKHSGFAEEKESRFFFVFEGKLRGSSLPTIKFRTRESIVIPYLDFAVGNPFEIWIGPVQSRFDNRDSVKMLLELVIPENKIVINSSRIPLR